MNRPVDLIALFIRDTLQVTQTICNLLVSHTSESVERII